MHARQRASARGPQNYTRSHIDPPWPDQPTVLGRTVKEVQKVGFRVRSSTVPKTDYSAPHPLARPDIRPRELELRHPRLDE